MSVGLECSQQGCLLNEHFFALQQISVMQLVWAFSFERDSSTRPGNRLAEDVNNYQVCGFSVFFSVRLVLTPSTHVSPDPICTPKTLPAKSFHGTKNVPLC